MLFKSLIAASLAGFATASNATNATTAAADAATTAAAAAATTAAAGTPNNNATTAAAQQVQATTAAATDVVAKDKWVNGSMSFKIASFDLGNVTMSVLATRMNDNQEVKVSFAKAMFESVGTDAQKTALGVSSHTDFVISNIRVKEYTRRLEEARQLAVSNTEIEFDYSIKTSQAKANSLVTKFTTDQSTAFITSYKAVPKVNFKDAFQVGTNPSDADLAKGSQVTPTTDATPVASSSTTTSSASGLGVSAVALLVACVMSM